MHLDFGHDKTSVAIFDKGNLIHSSILPVGSWHITSDISKAFNLKYGLHKEAVEILSKYWIEIQSKKNLGFNSTINVSI